MRKIRTVYKDTQEATNKSWAARDAVLRNKMNKTLWERAVQLKVERMVVALGELYADKVYEDFKKTTAGAKVNGTAVRNKRELERMEAAWAAEGIFKVYTARGIMYKVA